MALAARKTSQVFAHLAIAFAITYAVTGSMLVGSVAVVIEPLINVLLLPLHERAWATLRVRMRRSTPGYVPFAAEKFSQTMLHMSVAFAVMYWATGSLAFGGLAAVLEPVCNVLLLPVHERFWDNLLGEVRPARS